MYTVDSFNVSDFCATPAGASMNPDGICDSGSSSSASLSTLRVLQDGTTCAPGKPGWRESPMDTESAGCASTVVRSQFDASATAWVINITDSTVFRSARLLIKALGADQKAAALPAGSLVAAPTGDTPRLPVVHTVDPGDPCTWLAVVHAPGFRVDYQPPPRCTATAKDFKVSLQAQTVAAFCGGGASPRPQICASASAVELSLARDGCHRNASANGGAASSGATRQLQWPLSLAPTVAATLAALLVAAGVCTH
ncbi:hypothetical protein PINS_up023132 [Pythium insidiosum]|nr:hypothetical protein PINS_up023132 [Pythium insidiosum]